MMTTGKSGKEPMKQVLLYIPEDLLKAVDNEARSYYTSRSEFIRQALLWYLRPEAKARRQEGARAEEEPEDAIIDPEEVYKILHRQKQLAGMRKIMREQRHRLATEYTRRKRLRNQ